MWNLVYEVTPINSQQFFLLIMLVFCLSFSVYWSFIKEYLFSLIFCCLFIVLFTVFINIMNARNIVKSEVEQLTDIEILQGEFIFVDKKVCIYPVAEMSQCAASSRLANVGGKEIVVYSNPHLLNNEADYCFESFYRLNGMNVRFNVKNYKTNFSANRKDVHLKNDNVSCVLKVETYIDNNK